MAEPRYSMTEPTPPLVPMRPMIPRMTSLAVTPGGEVAVDGDGHGARRALGQRLGGQHVLHLAGADAEGQRPERAVGRGVAVAADDRQAGLGEAELGADHVDDALVEVAHRVEADAELGAVAGQRLHLPGGDLVGHRLVDVGGRNVVVHRGQRQVGPADRAAGQAEPVERLGRRDLVDEVEIDVEEVGFALLVADDVGVPHLLRQVFGIRWAIRWDIRWDIAALPVLASHILRRQYCYVDSITNQRRGPRQIGGHLGRFGRRGPVVPGRPGRGHRSVAPDGPPAGRRPGGPPAGRARRPGRYRLGLRLLGWAGAVSAELGLVEAARPVLEALRDGRGSRPSCSCATATAASASLPRSGPPGCATPCRSGRCCPSTGARGARCCWPSADPSRGGMPGVDPAETGDRPPPGLGGQRGRAGGGRLQRQRPRPRLAGRVHAAVGVSGPVNRLGRQPGSGWPSRWWPPPGSWSGGPAWLPPGDRLRRCPPERCSSGPTPEARSPTSSPATGGS